MGSAGAPVPSGDVFCSRRLEQVFARCFYGEFNTVLVGGAGEPLYQPAATAAAAHTLYYRADYFASALHEVAPLVHRGRGAPAPVGFWLLVHRRRSQRRRAAPLRGGGVPAPGTGVVFLEGLWLAISRQRRQSRGRRGRHGNAGVSPADTGAGAVLAPRGPARAGRSLLPRTLRGVRHCRAGAGANIQPGGTGLMALIETVVKLLGMAQTFSLAELV